MRGVEEEQKREEEHIMRERVFGEKGQIEEEYERKDRHTEKGRERKE